MSRKIHVGCSGFSGPGWRGTFYPEELPNADFLSFYAKQLNCLEINSTFYRKPRVSTLEKWYAETPPQFKFFVKIPKIFTHEKKLENCAEAIADFCRYIALGLHEKLAGFLFQFPKSFSFTDENLNRVLFSVASVFINVVEFREKAWWQPSVQETLSKNNIVFSGVSSPSGVPAEVIRNSPHVLYYRLHGVPQLFKSRYSSEDLAALANEIKTFNGDVFVFFNNTWGAAGILNALEFRDFCDG